MSETRTIAFTKMNGLGNDFVIIDARDNALSLSGDDVRALAARTHAQTQGCDQLLVIHPPRNSGDAFMQIFNADGGEVEACGNGTRAVAAYLAHKGMAAVKIETLGGILACTATLADRLLPNASDERDRPDFKRDHRLIMFPRSASARHRR